MRRRARGKVVLSVVEDRWALRSQSALTPRPLTVKDPPSSRSSQRRQNANVPKVLLMCDSNFFALRAVYSVQCRWDRKAWR